MSAFRKSLIDALVPRKRRLRVTHPWPTECEHALKQVFRAIAWIGAHPEGQYRNRSRLAQGSGVFRVGAADAKNLASGFRKNPVKETFLEVRVGTSSRGPRSSPPLITFKTPGGRILTNVVGGSKYRKRGKNRRLQEQRCCRPSRGMATLL